MALFDRPTLSELVTRTREDFRGRLGLGGALLRRAMADVLGTVWAGLAHLMHGHIYWLSEQLFATTAVAKYLLTHASLYGVYPNAATFARGNVVANGDDGTPIPLGTIFVRPDGATYASTAAVAIGAGSAVVPVMASEAGQAGNLEAGGALAFESPIGDINSDVAADGNGLDFGFDAEKVEPFRARFLAYLREKPEGGTDADYVRWAKEAGLGATRVFVVRHEDGPGTVAVRFVQDGDAGGDIFPDLADREAMQIEIDAERPITAEVTVKAIDPVPLVFTFASISPDNATVRAAVEAELADLLFRKSAPGNDPSDGTGEVRLTHVCTAIGVAEDIEDYDLTAPAANFVPGLGEMAVAEVVWPT